MAVATSRDDRNSFGTWLNDPLVAGGLAAGLADIVRRRSFPLATGETVRDRTLSRATFRTYVGWLRSAVRDDLERGTACGCAKTAATCRALLAHERRLWTFVRSFARSGSVEKFISSTIRTGRREAQWLPLTQSQSVLVLSSSTRPAADLPGKTSTRSRSSSPSAMRLRTSLALPLRSGGPGYRLRARISSPRSPVLAPGAIAEVLLILGHAHALADAKHSRRGLLSGGARMGATTGTGSPAAHRPFDRKVIASRWPSVAAGQCQ